VTFEDAQKLHPGSVVKPKVGKMAGAVLSVYSKEIKMDGTSQAVWITVTLINGKRLKYTHEEVDKASPQEHI